jgi:pimeloyl-ACP methyl ester carboxylesterase
MMQQLQANGIDLSYVEQGTGTPVVFVHGAWMDLRYWEPQRQSIAAQYRFVAYNLRYHGTAPWPDAGQHFSVAAHSADLAAFIRGLNRGPVHLVGLSSGGRLVTLVALGQPDLVRSLTVLEPPIDELLADTPEGQRVRDEWIKAFEPIRTAALAGDAVRAAKLFFDLANNQGSEAFDKQPETFRQMVLDNARTIPLQLLALRDRPEISRNKLSRLKVRTLVVSGEQSPRYLPLINEVVAQCISGSQLVVVPRATHLMSHQNPGAFNEELLNFLAQQ